MNRLSLMSLMSAACAAVLLGALPCAQATQPAQAKKAAPAKAAAAKPAASAAAPEPLSQGQLDVVDRVLTGVADCEFKQKISVEPVPGQRGHFEVRFQKARYVMTPRETTTGAVRLEDPRSGMLWIQIPAKSMLMDSHRGQRVVDYCMHAEQRAAVSAVQEAAVTLGIAPAAAQTASAPATAPAAAAAPASAASR